MMGMGTHLVNAWVVMVTGDRGGAMAVVNVVGGH